MLNSAFATLPYDQHQLVWVIIIVRLLAKKQFSYCTDELSTLFAGADQ